VATGSETKKCSGYRVGDKEMQWLQDPRQRNVVNLNSVEREVCRHLRKKGRNISQLKLRNLKLTVRSQI
jgi:hypothetical protein